MNLKKIKIPIGILFKKLGINHPSSIFDEKGFSFPNFYNIYVKDPQGNFKRIQYFVTKKSDIYKVLTKKSTLYVSDKHLILENGKLKTIKEATSIDYLDGNYKILSKEKYKSNEIVYDITIDSPHLYVLGDGSIHHNTKVSTYAFLYDICRLLHLKNPQGEFKLPETTKIVFMLTNSSLETAESINFDPLMAIIRESPFFVENFSKSGRTLFEKNIDIKIASRKRQLVGRDVYCAISDEVNQEVVKGGSFELVTEMINRINSRFLLKGNKWPGHYFVISSAQTENSLIERLKEQFEEMKDSIEIINPARFEVLKHKIQYSGKKFKVFIGTYDADPFIIETENDFKKALDIDPNKIFDVPIEHKQEFIVDIYAGIQDVLGKPTISTKTFFKDKSIINKAMSLTKLYDKDYVLVSDNVSERIIDQFDYKRLLSFGENFERVIGIDFGLNRDRLGFVMLHRRSEIKIEREIAGKLGTFEDFVYWADLAIAMLPENPSKKIRLEKIRDFIRDLSDIGFKIKLIVMDGFQSVDTQQILQNEGYEVKQYSVDRDKKAYYTLRYAIEEGRLKIPNNYILKEELSLLIENMKKIDHIEDVKSQIEILKQRNLMVSKDIADALVNALYNFQSIPPSPLENDAFIRDLTVKTKVKSDDELYNFLYQFKQKEFKEF
jgi:hypothetical protein